MLPLEQQYLDTVCIRLIWNTTGMAGQSMPCSRSRSFLGKSIAPLRPSRSCDPGSNLCEHICDVGASETVYNQGPGKRYLAPHSYLCRLFLIVTSASHLPLFPLLRYQRQLIQFPPLLPAMSDSTAPAAPRSARCASALSDAAFHARRRTPASPSVSDQFGVFSGIRGPQ